MHKQHHADHEETAGDRPDKGPDAWVNQMIGMVLFVTCAHRILTVPGEVSCPRP